ncbi:MAG: SDR family oxidoreductase [Nostoc sp. ChiSLP03a]|nr:SDR family NAD(P)-dependent oxidoreductase [Nostoc sp. ChiSLP03a]MDZ8216122.1 SDR family NAD(P)-dependent oxidoreductase [Nostoc sp. ChiSLP03a]
MTTTLLSTNSDIFAGKILMNLTDNTILITGGTSGIGRGLAEAFYQRGNQVIIAGRRQHLLDEITAAHSGMHGIQLDVQDPADIEAFASRVREQFPKLNVLINNAGIAKTEDLTSDPIDFFAIQSMIQTNVVGVLHLTAALLPTLKQQPHSTIVTTTSGLAFVPISPYPTYCASKAFLHSWLQSLRVQLQETSVEVLELAPPYVQTELGGASQATDPAAMPLADFIAEVMQILSTPNPPHGEILVNRVKALRFAERNGEYEQIFASRNEQ